MKKIVFLPYDFDTAIGINNEGSLAFGYNLEDVDQVGSADVFNGQQSVLWKNLRACFFNEIRSMYQNLRSTGKLSYQVVEQMFEEHQDKWPEAIFNEDAFFKYLQPLIDDGSGAYLDMLQGSKAEQRKWWLYNRFRYIDSKYNAGDALTDVIQLRGYAKDNITITPYADVYPSVKYGSYLVQQRGSRNVPTTLVCPLDNLNDTEIYIYSASQLASVGDLSGLMVGFADFSMATKLQSLKIGDSDAQYSNGNLTSLTLGNNTLLQTIDVRNCPNLAQAVDISGCTNIENVYFDGTAITGCTLPNGGVLKVLHLPDTITNLTIRNQPSITSFVMSDYSNITTLRIENVSNAVDVAEILADMPANSRVRLIGFTMTMSSTSDVDDFVDLLDTMRGLDESGNNVETAQISGTINGLGTITGAWLASVHAKYPNLTIGYEHITSNLYYYNYDGSSLLYTEEITDGGNGAYAGTPTRTATAQYTYTFAGWSRSQNATVADATATQNVLGDRNVYAAYTETIRTYTVNFYNGSTLLQTVNNVPYGSDAIYSGAIPVDSENGYEFENFDPDGTNITGDTNCYAQFASPIREIADDWDTIIANINNETAASKYNVGNYKPVNFGSEGIINMQIVGKNVDTLADNTGTATFSFVAMNQLNTKQKMVSDTLKTEGWKNSDLRDYVNTTIKNLIQSNVKHAIKTILKTSPAYGGSVQTEDDLWIPTKNEISNSSSLYGGIIYDDASRQRSQLNSNPSAWYLRTNISNGYTYLSVKASGEINSNGVQGHANTYGVVIGFCM